LRGKGPLVLLKRGGKKKVGNRFLKEKGKKAERGRGGNRTMWPPIMGGGEELRRSLWGKHAAALPTTERTGSFWAPGKDFEKKGPKLGNRKR